MLKTGEGVREEGEYCQYLPVAPRVIALLENGYVMELLNVPEPDTTSAITLELLLLRVWSLPATENVSWNALLERFPDIHVPRQSLRAARCMVHGDPTISNLLLRGCDEYVIGDPVRRSYIPQVRGVDTGKILQSVLGWESVAYGWPYVSYEWPDFMKDRDALLDAMFWCAVHLRRIRLRSSGKIHEWCARVGAALEQETRNG